MKGNGGSSLRGRGEIGDKTKKAGKEFTVHFEGGPKLSSRQCRIGNNHRKRTHTSEHILCSFKTLCRTSMNDDNNSCLLVVARLQKPLCKALNKIGAR